MVGKDVTNKKNSSEQKYKGSKRASELGSCLREGILGRGSHRSKFSESETHHIYREQERGHYDWSVISRGRMNGDKTGYLTMCQFM